MPSAVVTLATTYSRRRISLPPSSNGDGRSIATVAASIAAIESREVTGLGWSLRLHYRGRLNLDDQLGKQQIASADATARRWRVPEYLQVRSTEFTPILDIAQEDASSHDIVE
jgi:hypothetical protein